MALISPSQAWPYVVEAAWDSLSCDRGVSLPDSLPVVRITKTLNEAESPLADRPSAVENVVVPAGTLPASAL